MTVSPTVAPPMLVTLRQAAQELCCCERVAWQLVKDKELRSIKLGRSVRIPRSELERFITARLSK